MLATGMHPQRKRLQRIAEQAHRFGKLAVLGGPSVSACPEYYPEFDILHLGELGDGTDRDQAPRRKRPSPRGAASLRDGGAPSHRAVSHPCLSPDQGVALLDDVGAVVPAVPILASSATSRRFTARTLAIRVRSA